ncbi:glycosyl transferase family 36 [Thermoanaerobacter sp. YS13]|uniref:GH36-type glycosyl hydrolase domain-containing protein n=1 Tax=Thermoanaerobacter sp. YS13 TaxID=1511746 RepID=UPI000575800C|nr:glycosyl transferase family 36 [Thermoanaerobacter sp. YS13]KHO63084.1 glycosyl transferase family 36 [Thermoanaerobacter sp. YS13]
MSYKKMFENQYGYFSEDGREYVIKTPKTPRPWVNVISNGDYSFIVSQTGSGFSWRGNAVENRLTRYSQDIIKDEWGKYIYIRDEESKEFWSASWKPVCSEPDFYEVRHGIGYSVITQTKNGIKSSLKMFVAPYEPVELWELTLTNETDRKRVLNLFTYLEWNLGFGHDEHREFHKIFIDTKYEKDINGFIVNKYLWGLANKKGQHNNRSWEYVAFHTTSEVPVSYDGDKESFIGMYGSQANPKAMEEKFLKKNTGRFGDAIGALQVEVVLDPGETKKIAFTLGCADNLTEALELSRKYNNVTEVENAFEKVKEFWSRFIDSEKINTPDDGMNIMTNIWLKYQAISCRIWGKAAYYQISGGYGYRDQLQDSMIFLESIPEYTKRQILMHASKQKRDGTVLHWWMTISGNGPETKCSDDLLWLPFITINYLKETNDFDILNEVVPFLDGNEGNLYEHCKRSIERAFMRFSPRGVPLIGENDWNDGLSAVGWDWKGESFWLGEFLYVILEDFKYIARKIGDIKFANKCDDVQNTLKDSINRFGWDGEWYLQATTDEGEKVGSKENDEGFIYLNPQTWAVISGIADPERSKVCMESVSKYLLRDYGTLLLYPAYSKVREDIGYITRYAPGLRENGGVYTHAATWSIIAYILINQIDKAYEVYRKICPPNRSSNIEHYKAEPYVLPGNTDGPQSHNYGRGSWTWYTGSAQWLHRVATNWILGVRADYDGLIVDPAIPAEWEGFTYTRKFRNSIYNIVVENKEHVQKGVKEIYIDGKLIEGNKIPDLNDGKTHEVKVIMGK